MRMNERLAEWLRARPMQSDTARYRTHHLLINASGSIPVGSPSLAVSCP